MFAKLFAIFLTIVSVGVADARFDSSLSYKFFRNTVSYSGITDPQDSIGLPSSYGAYEVQVNGYTPWLSIRSSIELPQRKQGEGQFTINDITTKKPRPIKILSDYIGSFCHVEVGYPMPYGRLTVEPQVSILSDANYLALSGDGYNASEMSWITKPAFGVYVSQRLNQNSQVQFSGAWTTGLSFCDVWIDYYSGNQFVSVGYCNRQSSGNLITKRSDGLGLRVGVMF